MHMKLDLQGGLFEGRYKACKMQANKQKILPNCTF